jgi:hypothetical protein
LSLYRQCDISKFGTKKTSVSLGSITKQVLEMTRARGLGGEDNTALVKVFEELWGIQVRGERHPG